MFGMGTGVTLAVISPETCCRAAISGGVSVCGKKSEDDASQLNRLELLLGLRERLVGRYALGKFYGQAERAISTGKLNALLRLHLQPIKLVVF